MQHFKVPTYSGISVIPTSEVCRTILLILEMTGNENARYILSRAHTH